MYGRPAIEITARINSHASRTRAQPGIPKLTSAPLAARATSAEEEAAAARDWTIAPTPIPHTTDAERVALWLHGKSPHTIRAYGDDVAAFRRFTGKSRGQPLANAESAAAAEATTSTATPQACT